jgi:hypothetical protein
VSDDDFLASVQTAVAYRPQPGDVLFLEADFDVSAYTAERLQMQFAELVPGVKVVVLAKGMRVSVVAAALSEEPPQ